MGQPWGICEGVQAGSGALRRALPDSQGQEVPRALLRDRA